MSLFEQAERGAFPEIQLTLRKAEKRFPVLKGFIEKLLSCVEELDGRVRVLEQLPAGVTPALAGRQRRFLQSRYDLLKNFKASVAQIALAEIRGYAVLQKHRYQDGGPNDGAVSELYWLEPWVWARDGYYGDFYYNEISRLGVGLGSCASTFGEPCRIGSKQLPREDFVLREVESPLYEIALIAFVNWLMGRKDYAAFVEIFGLAKGVVIMPPNIAIGKEQDYQTAAEKVSDGASGALPAGADIKFPTAGVRGESPFEKYCEAQDKDFVMAATSGILAMLTEGGGGLNRGPHAEHGEAWDMIARMKGMRINEVLRKDFDAVELAAAFPGQPICVQFAMSVKEPEDVGQMLDNAVKLEGIGYQTDEAEISQRTGFKINRVAAAPGDGGPTLDDPLAGLAVKDDLKVSKSIIGSAVKNRLVKLLNRAGADDAEQFYRAIAADLKPLHDRLAAIDKISDPAIQRQKLADLYADLDQLTKDLVADPESARVLEGINAGAVVEGLQDKVKNRGSILVTKVLNFAQDQPRDSLGKWVDENGGGLSVRDNIQRGKKAMDRAIRQKKDVQKAMYRKGVGQIDFPHGTPGDSAQDFAGGHGVSHIVAKHGEADARALPEVLAKGRISSNPRDPENKRLIQHGAFEASLVKENTRKAWLLTGFRKQVAG
jgi:hypothetical protein